MNAADGAVPDGLHDQPYAIVEREGVRYTLLGTAHVSQASVEAVEAALASGRYDTIAVELDAQRHVALTDPDALSRLDLFQILREGKTGLVAANLALSAYQRRLAEQLKVEPGAELKAAAVGATERGLRLALVDRDVGITLRRAFGGLGFWGRTKLIAGLGASLLADEEVEAGEIEKLKQGDVLESSFGEFAEGSPPLYRAVIAERDRYMAARLRQVAADGGREVLAVVGAGHLKGLAEHLRGDQDDPAAALSELDALPRSSNIPWFTIFLAVFLLGGFAWGWVQGGAAFGGELVLQWALITAVGGALGCLAAGGHPLSILAAAISSPFTPLHPALASGTVSAAVEAWVRKPTYADFLRLRDDTGHVTGWWKNRVARVLVNFFLTSLGTAVAVWIGGANLVSKLT
ncbi:MAG: conjugal transfer protein TraB [Arenimonas sp. SCN 70-307]|uniref:TraB/GumN family protein n=1 Tax=Arenimonas sp. SCN 70-307 TaxID=1660089 RepID=UPI00086E8555|nr:TraB/GumN family protein [Arenimonas sp. SCN 70-307]ODS62271.1 MAG: conjugal transfer protein TraB [Arenimonas sp. SCN 70-307]